MLSASKSVTKKLTQGTTVPDLLAGKWTLLVVQSLETSVKRHSELSKLLPDITQKVLTETLRKLEHNGIVERKIYPTIPPQVEYKLTEIGLDLLTLSGVLSDWIDTHTTDIVRAQASYDRRNKV